MNWDRPLRLQPCCLSLRHKMMYCDERQATPGLVDAQSDTRVYFCVKSQASLGPDNQPVHPAECTSGRGCYCSPHPSTGSEADHLTPISTPSPSPDSVA